jgi:hypothetical protein
MVELEQCLGPEMDRGEVDIGAVLSRSGDLDHALEVALGAKQIGQRQADDRIVGLGSVELLNESDCLLQAASNLVLLGQGKDRTGSVPGDRRADQGRDRDLDRGLDPRRRKVLRGECIGQGDWRLDDRLEMTDGSVAIASMEGARGREQLGTENLWILGAGLFE